MTDVRDILFREIADKKFRAVLTAERSGVFLWKIGSYNLCTSTGH